MITVNELIATLAEKNVKINDQMIYTLGQQIINQGLNFPTKKDRDNAVTVLAKLLAVSPDPFAFLLVMAAAFEKQSSQAENIPEKNLNTLIMQLTKELIKVVPETLKTMYMNIIKNNWSDRPHIKPFMDFISNYKGEVEQNEVTVNLTGSVTVSIPHDTTSPIIVTNIPSSVTDTQNNSDAPIVTSE